MSSKVKTAIIGCLVLAMFAPALLAADAPSKARNPRPQQSSGEAGATTAPAPNSQPAVALPAEFQDSLDEMLRLVNEGKKPSKDDIAGVESLLQQNKKNLLRFDAQGKMKYSMLSAWTTYFAGNTDGAVQAAAAGLAAVPDNADMKATYAAMAVSSAKYPMLGKLAVKPVPTTRKKPKNSEMEEPKEKEATSAGTLSFDTQALRPQAVGKKMGVMDGNFNCIGGATFSPKSDLLCVLAWRSVDVPKPKAAVTTATPIVEEEATSSEKSTSSNPDSAFGALMVEYTGCDKVSFVGVNLDDATASYNAMKEVAAKGWFWPQIMAMEPSNKAFSELAKYDVSKPTMAIVTKDGTIAYMGSPAGFLPKMVLAKATGDYAPKLFVPAKPIGAMDPNARKGPRPMDPNMRGRRVADPNAKVTGDLDEALQTGSELKAEELYNNAKSFLKGSRTTKLTAGPGVQACRQILQQYPNTPYAAKARELLAQLPDELKTRYNITPAEMGQ
jgi:hypothetical protein